MNNMLGYLRDYKRESVLAPLFKMLEATFDLFVPLVMADIVNVGIAAHDLHYILVRCGILLVLAVIGLTCSLTAQYFSAKAAVGYSTSLRHALFAHIQSLSFSEMDTLGTSTLITRMTSDINQVQSGLNLFLRLFLRSPFVVIGAMVMAFTVNARAALIFVVAIPLLSVVVFGVMVITRPLYKTAQVRLDRVLGLTRENLTGVRVVRAFDKEQDEIDRFENANDLLTKMQLHVGHLSALMSPLTYVIINIAIVALLYVGSIEINVGGMASGDVIALVNYMNQILIELVKLANLIVQVSKALACAGRVQAVLDTKPGMDFPAELRSEVPADKAGDAVRFDHVSLTYAGAGAPSLSDISFTAKCGQTIGVIGGTGSGKSSLVNLIPRFYDATEGTVEILGRLPPRGPARQGECGHAEGPAVRRHHPLQPAVGQQECHRRRAVGSPGDRTGGRIRPGKAPWPGRARGTGRPEPFRRPEAAPDHCPCIGGQAGHSDPGRQRQRPGLRHRRGPAQGTGRSARQPDRVHRKPARCQPAACRPDPCAG